MEWQFQMIPGTLPYIFQWWDNSGLLSNSQDLFITQSGVYYCIVYDYNNCHSDTIQYNIQNVGVEDLNKLINIYPNPTNDKLFIETSHLTPKIDVIITDILGKRISPSTRLYESLYIIDFSTYAKGVYLLSVHIDDARYFRKIIVE